MCKSLLKMLCLMLTYLVGLGLKFGIRVFNYIHTLCMQAVKALGSLGICAGLSEHTFLYNVIRTKISGASS